VLSIWNGKSPLSENDNLLNLVLVRWDKYEQWSPWNTILLTRDEADAHDKLDDVMQVYRFNFINFFVFKKSYQFYMTTVSSAVEIGCMYARWPHGLNGPRTKKGPCRLHVASKTQ